MHRRMTRVLHAAAAAGVALGALGLAGAGAASAATAPPKAMGPPVYTRGYAGYLDGGGRWFRFVSTTLTVPPAKMRGIGVGSAFIFLQHAKPTGLPAEDIFVAADGGAGSITWGTGVGRFRVSPKVGDRLAISIYYDRHGHDYLTATDITRGTSQTVPVTVGSVVYDSARLGGSPVSNVNPAASTRLWQFTNSHVTTYRGDHGTILGPWTTSQVIATTTGTAAGKVVISPSQLSNSGQNFAVWLRHR